MIIPILAVGLLLIMTKAHPIFERVFKRYDHLNNVVQENLLGIRAVKSFVREDHEVEKFGKVSQEIYMDFSKAERNPGLQHASDADLRLCLYDRRVLDRRQSDRDGRLHVHPASSPACSAIS